MARAANLLKKKPIKSVKKTPRVNKAAQKLLAGDEPGPFTELMVQSKIELVGLINWYNTNSDVAEHQKWVVTWARKNGFSKADVTKLQSAPKHFFNSSTGALARMSDRGLPLENSSIIFLKNRIANILSYEVPPALDESLVVKKKTPVSIIQTKTDTILAELEAIVDNWENNSEYSLYAELVKQTAASSIAKAIQTYYIPLRDELVELTSEKTSDLVEAYSSMSAMKRKKYLTFISTIVDDATRYLSSKLATRKIRVRKPVSALKLVSKVKYLKADPAYKITSVDPINIIGAAAVFVFNTKYRELRMYVADDITGLKIKSTTITNFNAAQSAKKRVRKPAVTFAAVLKTTKAKYLNVFNDIKAVRSMASGRLNGDCVILKIIK